MHDEIVYGSVIHAAAYNFFEMSGFGRRSKRIFFLMRALALKPTLVNEGEGIQVRHVSERKRVPCGAATSRHEPSPLTPWRAHLEAADASTSSPSVPSARPPDFWHGAGGQNERRDHQCSRPVAFPKAHLQDGKRLFKDNDFSLGRGGNEVSALQGDEKCFWP